MTRPIAANALTGLLALTLLAFGLACVDVPPGTGDGNPGGEGQDDDILDGEGEPETPGEPDGQGEPEGPGDPGEPEGPGDPGEPEAPSDDCNPDAPELCDNFDNNCNDIVDEGCTCTAPEKSCFAGPPSTMGVGRCRAGSQACEREFYGPCEGQVLPEVEVCNGLDDDCDGLVDEDFAGVGSTCSEGDGDCSSQGRVTCTEDGAGTFCDAVAVEPGPEQCDGLDNDCDGQIDEDFTDLGDACTVGLGQCVNTGVEICTRDGAGTICSAQPRATQPELCDGLDNNCNGQIDETFPGVGGVCQAGQGVCAREGVGRCAPDGRSVICDATPGTAQQETCDGLDNDCDGQVDELPECNNHDPVVTCTPDINADVLQTVNVNATAVDPDGDRLTLRWQMVSAPIGSGAAPSPTNQNSTSIFLDLAGDYVLRFTATDPLGQSASCTSTVHAIPSERLRVEIIWNIGVSNDPSDVDLHLLRTDSGGTWFDNRWDCYYANCNASRGQNLEWGLGGNADNPRLDLDDVQGNGPENINIDNPQAHTYRLGVHYYDNDGFGAAPVIVRIYCNAQLFREFEPVSLRASGANNSGNDFWTVADIVWNGNTCTINEFGTPNNRDIRTRGSL